MKPRLLSTLLAFAALGISANAGTFTFNFNSLASGANSAAIATYMDGVLGCANCVTVTGAIADRTYSGENNVVGPGGVPVTLGTTDNAANNSATPGRTYDTFLANTSDSSVPISQEISISFTGMSIASASFDYEIFPDGTCASLGWGHCGGPSNNGSTSLANNPNTPDFEFTTGAAVGGTNIFTTYGVAPSASGTNGTSTLNGSTTIHSPQYVGMSGLMTLGGVSELNFIDWPATIGVDNLVLTTTTSGGSGSVPEPTSVLLLATACAGVVVAMRRRFSELS